MLEMDVVRCSPSPSYYYLLYTRYYLLTTGYCWIIMIMDAAEYHMLRNPHQLVAHDYRMVVGSTLLCTSWGPYPYVDIRNTVLGAYHLGAY